MKTADNATADLGRWLARCLGNSPASPLGEDDVAAILRIATAESVAAGSVLFRQDDPSQDVFIVETGKIALVRSKADRQALLQILHPGDVFGDVGLFLGRNAPVDALVIEHANMLRIDGADLVRLVSTRPRVAVRWMVAMAARLADGQDRLDELLAGSLDRRLATLLLHAADDRGRVAVGQDMLSQLLGARRPSVSRSLGQLEDQGLLRRRYGSIEITDRPGLADLSS